MLYNFYFILYFKIHVIIIYFSKLDIEKDVSPIDTEYLQHYIFVVEIFSYN